MLSPWHYWWVQAALGDVCRGIDTTAGQKFLNLGIFILMHNFYYNTELYQMVHSMKVAGNVLV